jgi:hypothetical protein
VTPGTTPIDPAGALLLSSALLIQEREMLEIADLTREEDLALIGLLKAVIQADKELSFEENEELKRIAGLMGRERFHERVGEAKEMFVKLSDIKGFVRKIDRKPARRLIFDLLKYMAERDGINPAEDELMAWLAEVWELAYFKG